MSQAQASGVKVLYTAEATVVGGRSGHARSSDGRLEIDLSVPSEMGGDGGPGTNPEQLFAAGYAACFQGALNVIGRREHVSMEGASITARVGIGPNGPAFGLVVDLAVHLPAIEDRATAEQLVQKAHQVCPYSRATRDNIEVRLSVV